MQQDDTAEKAYDEMSRKDLFQRMRSQADIGLAKTILKEVYAIGFDEGRKQGASHGKPVAQYDMNGKFIKIFGNISIAARAVNRNKAAVQKAANGKSEYSGGYKWKYASNESTDRSNVD
jgi:hypothetical protein